MKPYLLSHKTQLGIVLALLFWGEWLSFEWSALTWQSPSQGLRVLIVADPQLLGYQGESTLLGSLTRWDADRYTFRGFRLAERFSQPDVVLFLGDLFDEGVEGSPDEFLWTLSRFRSIFPAGELSRIFIAGDNDVGGENEPVWPKLKDRFSRTFSNEFPARKKWNNIEILETNLFDQPAKTKTLLRSGENRLKVMLSHSPLLSTVSLEYPALRSNLPDLILSAHDHSAWIHSTDKVHPSTRSEEITTKNNWFEGKIGGREDPLVELQTPTCSYRMGTSAIGYGLLTLEQSQNGAVSYSFTVLWMPSRFFILFLYILYVSIIFILNLCKLQRRKRFVCLT